MVDEAPQNICRQVVFLIDSNPSFWGSNCSFEDTSNAIRLCVLKILTYFSNNGRGKRSNLRWGYKFFNSRTLSHQFERHEFKDFSVEVFEDFETEVSKKLNESFAQVSNTLEQHEPDGEKDSSFGKPPAGAKCISCALTNAVHDFQWERPDISSPVRSTRGNNNLLHGNRSSNTRNVMFLLSGCPCNEESISNFTGETSSSLRTFDSVKNILMPPMLFKEFKQRQIYLHWVNVGNDQQEVIILISLHYVVQVCLLTTFHRMFVKFCVVRLASLSLLYLNKACVLCHMVYKVIMHVAKMRDFFVIPLNSNTFFDWRMNNIVTCHGSKVTNSLLRTKFTSSLR